MKATLSMKKPTGCLGPASLDLSAHCWLWTLGPWDVKLWESEFGAAPPTWRRGITIPMSSLPRVGSQGHFPKPLVLAQLGPEDFVNFCCREDLTFLCNSARGVRALGFSSNKTIYCASTMC